VVQRAHSTSSQWPCVVFPAYTRHTKIESECQDDWRALFDRRASKITYVHPLAPSAETRRRAWDDEIRIIKEVLTMALARRNAFSPSSSLPAEILARIFEFVIYPKECAVVGSVSRMWRSVAHNHAKLWSNFQRLLPNHGKPVCGLRDSARSPLKPGTPPQITANSTLSPRTYTTRASFNWKLTARLLIVYFPQQVLLQSCVCFA
jgi:hypothetical protein